jgi:hypothetical protein
VAARLTHLPVAWTPDDDEDGPPPEDAALDQAIASGDLDEVLREVDRRADAGDWVAVDRARHRARAATERGHQLWPAASWAEYRTALEAPAAWAGPVVTEGTGYLAPGPMAEVAAQRHTWEELSVYVPVGPLRGVVAAERVVRGETVPPEVLTGDLPGRLLAWEPGYALVEYKVDGVQVDDPAPLPRTDPVPAGTTKDEDRDAADGRRALVDAVRHWSSQGEATVRAVGVEGSAADALATLGVTGARWAEVGVTGAAELLAWAAASGGARGRRRGAAAGRFDAWWVLAVLSGTADDWPTDPGPAAEDLRWWRWTADDHVGGWECRIAAEDPLDGLAWALDAYDPPTD